jgi:single-strand DNA-binding protein
VNKVILIGRLTRDPEMRFTPANGVPVTTFTLAVDRPFLNQKGEREADFIRIVTWRKLAETCGNYLKKGMLTAISGRLQIRSYEGQDGQRRYITEVVADEMQFLEKKQTGQGMADYDSIDEDFGPDDFGPQGDGVPF